jgi:preprotein translocase subunit SecF
VQQVNVRGRFIVIAVVTLLSVWLYHKHGLKLAQDLKGGTSVRFSIDVERAKAEGRVPADETAATVMADTIRVIGERINRSGLSEVEPIDLGENKSRSACRPATRARELIQIVTTLGDSSSGSRSCPTRPTCVATGATRR